MSVFFLDINFLNDYLKYSFTIISNNRITKETKKR